MKITIQDIPEGEEDEIIIRCREIDERLMKMIYALKAGRDKMTVSKEGKLFQIQPASVYFFEAVDNRTFAYLERDVYETRFRLYELEERLVGTDFFRATKSTIINLAWVESLSPAFSGRFEVSMKNGEKLIVSRQYVPILKEKLGLS